MSNTDFARIMKVGDILQAFKNMDDLVGEPPKVQLSETALLTWETAVEEYEAFYKMSLVERMAYADLNTNLTQQDAERSSSK